jgi:hypothetical protein
MYFTTIPGDGSREYYRFQAQEGWIRSGKVDTNFEVIPGSEPLVGRSFDGNSIYFEPDGAFQQFYFTVQATDPATGNQVCDWLPSNGSLDVSQIAGWQ